ncbi:lactoylglutathione lyase [Rhizobium leguminosarum]|uniref:VOC family protein n=1 Tax=Rhizobium leguminosarum TaxID=384 RepID=UPI001C9654B0|nr:VOC family protein [Rhizobium leguminosarum]MBY5533682.1 lactoylglutathione lyase [Rhizobium leguminosarum]
MSKYYPVSVTHVGLTVTDVYAGTKWYTEAFNCRHIIGPLHIRNDGSQIGNVFKGIFGPKFEEGYVSHLATANGVGIELFQFVTPPSESKKENFEYWKTGVFHFCLVDPDIEGLAKRITDMGGKQRSDVWTLFPGEEFKAVYCEDPWGNLIEIYSHSTELMYANRDTDAFMVAKDSGLEDHRK